MKKISKLILLILIFLVTACTCEDSSKSTGGNSSQKLFWRSGVFVCKGTLVVKSTDYYLVYNFICEDGRTIVNLVNVTVK